MTTNDNVTVWQKANKIIRRAKNPELLLSCFKREDEAWATGKIFIRNRELGGIIKEYADEAELEHDVESGGLKKFVKGRKELKLSQVIEFLLNKQEELDDVWDEYSEGIIDAEAAVEKADKIGYSIFDIRNDLREATYAISEIIEGVQYEFNDPWAHHPDSRPEGALPNRKIIVTIDSIVNYLEKLEKQLRNIRNRYSLNEIAYRTAVAEAAGFGFGVGDVERDLRQATFAISQTIDNIWAEL